MKETFNQRYKNVCQLAEQQAEVFADVVSESFDDLDSLGEFVDTMADITGDLNSLKQVVGGYIEAVYPFDDPVAIVCNEEGKLIGLPLNRKLEDYDIIAGTFIVCGLGEDDFASLSPELADKYREKFANPEIFMKMGSHIVAIPVKPKDELHVAKTKQKSTEPEL